MSVVVVTFAVAAAAVAGALLPRGSPRRLASVLEPRRRSRAHPGRDWLTAQVDRRAQALRRAAVVDLCEVLSCDLAAGAQPGAALAAVCDAGSCGQTLGLTQAERGDIAAALRRCGQRRGAEGLLFLETCWRLSERTGSSLARPVARLAEALRDEEQVRRVLAVELTGVRATAVLLAFLPLAGVALGSMLGVAPLDLLVSTPIGRGCLLLGSAFELAGCWWMARITRAAGPS